MELSPGTRKRQGRFWSGPAHALVTLDLGTAPLDSNGGSG
jgi:hypothetical protein